MFRLLFALALFAAPLAATAVQSSTLLPPRVEHAINERIGAGEYPAMVVAVVDGERSHVYAFGKLDNGKAPDAYTVFQIGSVTKTFTATLLAETIEKGEVKLDTPVSDLLPGFTIPSRNGKSITLGELAMQDSGLPRLPTNMTPPNPHDPYAAYDAAKLKEFLATYKLTRDPGAKYEYSNLGVGLLGNALAQHAGTSYAGLLQTRIFKPLDMASSSARFSEPLGAHWAMGHDINGQPVEPWHLDVLAGAGAINSTGADMLRYLEANLGLGPAQLVAAMQLAQKPHHDIGKGEQIGLVWMTRHDKDGEVVWHNGMTGGYTSFMGFTADSKRGVVILTNITRPINDLGFATLLANAPLAPVKKQIAMTPQRLDTYVGAYQLAPKFFLNVLRQGDQLFAQATGQGSVPIFPSARDAFFARVAGMQIDFRHGKNGKVASLMLHQNGHDILAPKLDAEGIKKSSGHKVMHLDAAMLQQYVGRYGLAPGMVFDITLLGDQLSAQLTGQPAFSVYPGAKDEFYYTVVDAQLSFERDKRGKIDALVLHQNGANRTAKLLP